MAKTKKNSDDAKRIAALQREYVGCVQQGKDSRVEAIKAELKRVGGSVPSTGKKVSEAPSGRSSQPKSTAASKDV